jgi:hypothetical protein
MIDELYNFTKSSCDCYNCYAKRYTVPFNQMTDITGCLYSKDIFKIHNEPITKNGIVVLNQTCVDKNYDYILKPDPCSKPSCFNYDSRLLNAVTGTWLQLDKPPNITTQKIHTISSDRRLDNYGKGYKSYSDVNTGQIVYYIDKKQQDAFFEPLFSEKSTGVGVTYKDPMDNIRYQHYRISNETKCNQFGNNGYCLSYIKDTQNHREDILSRQMRRTNETRYAPRYTNTLD